MATATRDTLITRIQKQVGDSGKTWTGELDLETWVQDCHNDLALTGYCTKVFRAASAANTYKYSIATLGASGSDQFNPIEIVEIGYLDANSDTAKYRPLRPLPFWKYRQYMRGTEMRTGTPDVSGTSDPPTHWCWHGDYLYLFPCPTTAITNGMKIIARVAQIFGADSDTTTLPQQFEAAVTYYGCMRQQQKERVAGGAGKMLEYWRQEYERKKRELEEWASGARTSGPERIPSPDERAARLA